MVGLPATVLIKLIKEYLWGMVKFHTGGKAHELARAEQVRFLRRRYSPDERRFFVKDLRRNNRIVSSPNFFRMGEFFYEKN